MTAMNAYNDDRRKSYEDALRNSMGKRGLLQSGFYQENLKDLYTGLDREAQLAGQDKAMDYYKFNQTREDERSLRNQEARANLISSVLQGMGGPQSVVNNVMGGQGGQTYTPAQNVQQGASGGQQAGGYASNLSGLAQLLGISPANSQTGATGGMYYQNPNGAQMSVPAGTSYSNNILDNMGMYSYDPSMNPNGGRTAVQPAGNNNIASILGSLLGR